MHAHNCYGQHSALHDPPAVVSSLRMSTIVLFPHVARPRHTGGMATRPPDLKPSRTSPAGGPANVAQTHTRIETQTYACMYRCTHTCINLYREKGNSLKSRSSEIVTSAALFTRLLPRCTQERVNQVRGYTRHRVARADHSQSPSEPERGYANGSTHRDEGWPFTRYNGTLYTIRVRMTVV